jgi:hypothetical protein
MRRALLGHRSGRRRGPSGESYTAEPLPREEGSAWPRVSRDNQDCVCGGEVSAPWQRSDDPDFQAKRDRVVETALRVSFEGTCQTQATISQMQAHTLPPLGEPVRTAKASRRMAETARVPERASRDRPLARSPDTPRRTRGRADSRRNAPSRRRRRSRSGGPDGRESATWDLTDNPSTGPTDPPLARLVQRPASGFDAAWRRAVESTTFHC